MSDQDPTPLEKNRLEVFRQLEELSEQLRDQTAFLSPVALEAHGNNLTGYARMVQTHAEPALRTLGRIEMLGTLLADLMGMPEGLCMGDLVHALEQFPRFGVRVLVDHEERTVVEQRLHLFNGNDRHVAISSNFTGRWPPLVGEFIDLLHQCVGSGLYSWMGGRQEVLWQTPVWWSMPHSREGRPVIDVREGDRSVILALGEPQVFPEGAYLERMKRRARR